MAAFNQGFAQVITGEGGGDASYPRGISIDQEVTAIPRGYFSLIFIFI